MPVISKYGINGMLSTQQLIDIFTNICNDDKQEYK